MVYYNFKWPFTHHSKARILYHYVYCCFRVSCQELQSFAFPFFYSNELSPLCRLYSRSNSSIIYNHSFYFFLFRYGEVKGTIPDRLTHAIASMRSGSRNMNIVPHSSRGHVSKVAGLHCYPDDIILKTPFKRFSIETWQFSSLAQEHVQFSLTELALHFTKKKKII